jgi:hypothetical protein
MAEEIPREEQSQRLDHTKLGSRLAEQAREKVVADAKKQREFAEGSKRYTEGK